MHQRHRGETRKRKGKGKCDHGPASLAREDQDADSLKDAAAYLRDSGIAFDDADDRVYEQARRGRSRRRGPQYTSPPSGALPPLPPPQSPSSDLQSPRSPPASARTGRTYAELLAAFQTQQQALARLRAANEEHARNKERLSADLLAMTHRYLQAQASVDTLEKRCNDAEEQVERLTSRLEEEKAAVVNLRRTPESLLSTKSWQMDHGSLRAMRERRNDDRGETATVSAGTVYSSDSSEYVSVNLGFPSNTPPEELLKLIRSINVQSSEVARACIASATFRPGVRMMQVDNKMVVELTEGIGCILVQILRSSDHSKSKATVELGLRALLCYHVSKLIEAWPSHAHTRCRDRLADESRSEDIPVADKDEYSETVENVLRDIATILSLSGSPGQPSSLVRSHRDRVGSTIDALFKTAETLASQIKGGRFDGLRPAEYSFLYVRPGATFNKDLMQRHNAQQTMRLWKSASKKAAQVLCTREVGLARLHRKPAASSSLSVASSRSGSSGQGLAPYLKEIEVLSKVVVVFESDLDNKTDI